MDRYERARRIIEEEELRVSGAARRPDDWLLPPKPEEDARPPAPEPDAPHLPKRNSSTALPTASLHCWHSAMRRSPSWAASSTQCCRSSALARAATSSSICLRISGAATRRDRHHHRFAQDFLAARGGVSDEAVRIGMHRLSAALCRKSTASLAATSAPARPRRTSATRPCG